MTIDKIWENCIAQWEWIVGEIEKGSTKYVDILKCEWRTENFPGEYIQQHCFFCHEVNWTNRGQEYDAGTTRWLVCKSCPGAIVDEHCYCMNQEYHFLEKPKEFLAELLRLDKIRRKTK